MRSHQFAEVEVSGVISFIFRFCMKLNQTFYSPTETNLLSDTNCLLEDQQVAVVQSVWTGCESSVSDLLFSCPNLPYEHSPVSFLSFSSLALASVLNNDRRESGCVTCEADTLH